jgi:hypothetical protein
VDNCRCALPGPVGSARPADPGLRASHTGPRMTCVDCGQSIHRNDRCRVLEVRHVDCRDMKLVGQMSLPAEGEA